MANGIDRKDDAAFGDDGAGAPAWLKKKQLEMYEQGMSPEEIRKRDQRAGEKVQEVVEMPEETQPVAGGGELVKAAETEPREAEAR